MACGNFVQIDHSDAKQLAQDAKDLMHRVDDLQFMFELADAANKREEKCGG